MEKSLFIFQNNRLRRITPLECESLRGFSDGYTDIFDPTKTSSDQNLNGNLPPGSITPPAKKNIDLTNEEADDNIIIDVPEDGFETKSDLIDSLNKAAGIPSDDGINNNNLTIKNFNDAMYNSIP